MRELPFDVRFTVGEQRVHLVHGSQRKVNEYLFDRLADRAAVDEPHTAVVVGPGLVGRAEDEDVGVLVGGQPLVQAGGLVLSRKG
jgi:hypothetical protein